jgi:hypothetical protein
LIKHQSSQLSKYKVIEMCDKLEKKLEKLVMTRSEIDTKIKAIKLRLRTLRIVEKIQAWNGVVVSNESVKDILDIVPEVHTCPAQISYKLETIIDGELWDWRDESKDKEWSVIEQNFELDLGISCDSELSQWIDGNLEKIHEKTEICVSTKDVIKHIDEEKIVHNDGGTGYNTYIVYVKYPVTYISLLI